MNFPNTCLPLACAFSIILEYTATYSRMLRSPIWMITADMDRSGKYSWRTIFVLSTVTVKLWLRDSKLRTINVITAADASLSITPPNKTREFQMGVDRFARNFEITVTFTNIETETDRERMSADGVWCQIEREPCVCVGGWKTKLCDPRFFVLLLLVYVWQCTMHC